ncbi:MAG TPA: HEPN domain-containing protein [Candidatus Hydrogenedentes bacterium]|nr:HEPN domain-containing protein [Candidatus Hydrogenedentota bacterium]
MKTSLSHLPKHKRHELEIVRDVIRTAIPGVHMIILFGSYARGDWVEDVYTEGHITYEYQSDFDVLVIGPDSNKPANTAAHEQRIKEAVRADARVATPLTIVYHTMKFVNQRLREGQYFFSDIKREGVLLYDSKKHKLARRRKLDKRKRGPIAQANFSHWIESGRRYYGSFQFNVQNEWHNEAAFLLHQATECAYTAVLLAFTGYKPKTHDLEKFGGLAGDCHPAFLRVFPRSTPEEKRLFGLLQKAYIDARYDPKYAITMEELGHLGARVTKLFELARELCTAKIASFDA